MKKIRINKISTKIVILSVINSLIVAAANVVASLFNNNHSGNSSPAGAAPKTGALIGIPTTVLIGLVISLALGIIISYILGKLISKPIIKVTELTKKTADLDLVDDSSFEKILNYKDESGDMAKALWDTRKSLREMMIRLSDVSSTISAHSSELTKITEENTKTITQVTETITELADGNSSQAQTVNQMNETMSEVVNLIDNITTETSKGAESAVKSLDFITDGKNAVDVQARKMDENISISSEANKSINELSEMIEQVADIVNVITSISDQTNLLALNAAIEAARAGEAGKGFAVVAEEIRKLSEESSSATQKITDIINNTNEKTSLAVSSIKKAGFIVGEQKEALQITQDAFGKIQTSYDDIVNGFKQTASSMTVIDKKSKDIFQQTQNISSTAEQFAASTEEISASSEEQLSSTEMIEQACKELNKLSDELGAEISKFKIE
ncbi:MAG: methyl-accepting chemotaxis protein [Bacillota bacterium]|nr:methyl-accepting chemotaxis protein [Bacillota bacterium]